MTLDLEHKTYMPYRKPYTQTVYINRKSYHPAHVLNHIPTMGPNHFELEIGEKKIKFFQMYLIFFKINYQITLEFIKRILRTEWKKKLNKVYCTVM